MEICDRTVKCATCGREFLFTTKEQEFFLGKGFKEPRHCRECRQARKQERDEAIAQTTGKSAVSGRLMFKVTCAQCQRETEVPFKPSSGKPVLCRDCFIAQRYGSSAPPSSAPTSNNSIPFKPGHPNPTPAGGLSQEASQVHMNTKAEPVDPVTEPVEEVSLAES
jgi:CxxC-x17-CxxC domain-containing protein